MLSMERKRGRAISFSFMRSSMDLSCVNSFTSATEMRDLVFRLDIIILLSYIDMSGNLGCNLLNSSFSLCRIPKA